MRIAVDVMGGDLGPEQVIEGAIKAAKENIQIILVGKKDIIDKSLKKHNIKNLPIFIQHADDVVEMDESPSKVIRNKKNSSMAVAFKLVKGGNAKAFISPGNTGAALGYGITILKRIKNLQRPAIAVVFPTIKGNIVLLDVGGNVDCKAINLFQFALMGALYAKNILDYENPSVALLSNGEEETKGNDVIRKAAELLKKSSLNYVGFKEGKDIFKGEVNVFVCDGFVGNICLKLAESVGVTIWKIMKKEIEHSFFSKIGAFFMKKSLSRLKEQIDYTEYGSAPMLGLSEAAFICHGSSNATAIYNGIKNAMKFIKSGYNEQLKKELEFYLDIEKKGFWGNIKQKIPF
jgi:glycerol-3-phosphate acyltransferase PlsX